MMADFDIDLGALVPYVSESKIGIDGAKLTADKVSVNG